MTFGNKIADFLTSLKAPEFSNTVEILNPYGNEEVKIAVNKFYQKYFNDHNSRVFIIGINPGRFGGGLTGVAFTDPIALEEICGVENSLGEKRELSSKFIYSMIDAFGGVEAFYSKFYLTALYPLAITENGKNYNYYDDLKLFQTLKPTMASYLKEQIKAGARTDIALCLGKKNLTFVEKINKEYGFFDQIRVLEHPRYIMQYKTKKLNDYIDQYVQSLNSCF